MSRKSFVLDTNVLLHDPDAILKFPGQDVYVPMAVLEELDRMKRLPNDLGANSRAVIRYLDSLKDRPGDWREGIEVENKAKIWIELDHKVTKDSGFALPNNISSNRILQTAFTLKGGQQEVVFVSKDFAARIKAEAVGLEAEDYENLKVPYSQLPSGVLDVDMTKSDIDLFYKDGEVDLKDIQCQVNQYVAMKSPENSSAVGKFNKALGRVEPLIRTGDIWGVTPRNIEQRCALDLLLRDDIKLVAMIGPAGTGKTLLALAVALRKVFDDNTYSRILVSRPVVPLGRDIGYLPGTKEEKLTHWMQPIFDNLHFLCDSPDNEPSETLRWVTESNKLEMEAVTYIRGRSLPKMFIIIDEAQNLTPHEMKTIISRAGEGTKVVLTGDPTQIDNPYLDPDSNGLTYTVDRFQNQPIFGHVFLKKTERSELAAIAANVM